MADTGMGLALPAMAYGLAQGYAAQRQARTQNQQFALQFALQLDQQRDQLTLARDQMKQTFDLAMQDRLMRQNEITAADARQALEYGHNQALENLRYGHEENIRSATSADAKAAAELAFRNHQIEINNDYKRAVLQLQYNRETMMRSAGFVPGEARGKSADIPWLPGPQMQLDLDKMRRQNAMIGQTPDWVNRLPGMAGVGTGPAGTLAAPLPGDATTSIPGLGEMPPGKGQAIGAQIGTPAGQLPTPTGYTPAQQLRIERRGYPLFARQRPGPTPMGVTPSQNLAPLGGPTQPLPLPTASQVPQQAMGFPPGLQITTDAEGRTAYSYQAPVQKPMDLGDMAAMIRAQAYAGALQAGPQPITDPNTGQIMGYFSPIGSLGMLPQYEAPFTPQVLPSVAPGTPMSTKTGVTFAPYPPNPPAETQAERAEAQFGPIIPSDYVKQYEEAIFAADPSLKLTMDPDSFEALPKPIVDATKLIHSRAGLEAARKILDRLPVGLHEAFKWQILHLPPAFDIAGYLSGGGMPPAVAPLGVAPPSGQASGNVPWTGRGKRQ